MTFTALIVTLVAARAGVARADEPTEDAPTSPQRIWYGWQTLAADAAVAGTWIAADATDSSKLAWLGVLGYFAAAPVVRAANGQPAWGLASLAGRLYAPLIGGIIGLSIGHAIGPDRLPEGDVPGVSPDEGNGAVIGFFGGMVLFSIFDAATSFKHPSEAQARPHREQGLAWAPAVTPTTTGTGTTFGLVGIF